MIFTDMLVIMTICIVLLTNIYGWQPKVIIIIIIITIKMIVFTINYSLVLTFQMILEMIYLIAR